MWTDKTPTRDYSKLDDGTLTATAETLANKLAAVRAKIARLTDECVQLVADEQAVADVQASRKLAGDSAEDWPWLLQADGASAVQCKAADTAIQRLATWDQGHQGLSADSTNSHTGQRALRVALIRGAPALTSKVQAALELLLPYIAPCSYGRKTTEVGKYVSVFEQSLSQHGTYFLAIDEEGGRYELIRQRYGSLSVVHTAVDLTALLTYVEAHCYYKSTRPQDDDQ